MNVPVAPEANAMTTRSLNFGSSTKRIWTINPTKSRAAHINTSVSGLSATSARMASAVSIKMTIQLTMLGKLLRTTEVIIMARHNVTMLNENSHAISSAINVGD